jgi:hypothetical protein
MAARVRNYAELSLDKVPCLRNMYVVVVQVKIGRMYEKAAKVKLQLATSMSCKCFDLQVSHWLDTGKEDSLSLRKEVLRLSSLFIPPISH